MLFNGVIPLIFLEFAESKVVVITFALAAMTQMVIYHKKGFVRLLGAGHFYWFPMLGWLSYRLNEVQLTEGMFNWIIMLIVLNVLSLLIDAMDVIRYWRGERSPVIVLQK